MTVHLSPSQRRTGKMPRFLALGAGYCPMVCPKFQPFGRRRYVRPGGELPPPAVYLPAGGGRLVSPTLKGKTL